MMCQFCDSTEKKPVPPAPDNREGNLPRSPKTQIIFWLDHGFVKTSLQGEGIVIGIMPEGSARLSAVTASLILDRPSAA